MFAREQSTYAPPRDLSTVRYAASYGRAVDRTRPAAKNLPSKRANPASGHPKMPAAIFSLTNTYHGCPLFLLSPIFSADHRQAHPALGSPSPSGSSCIGQDGTLALASRGRMEQPLSAKDSNATQPIPWNVSGRLGDFRRAHLSSPNNSACADRRGHARPDPFSRAAFPRRWWCCDGVYLCIPGCLWNHE